MTPEQYDEEQRRGDVCRRGIHVIGYPYAAICPLCGQRVAWIETEIERLKQKDKHG